MLKKFINKIFDIHPEAISFKQGLELTDLPIVTFSQRNIRLNFLLDSGSTGNIIDKNVLDKIEYKLLPQKESLYGMEGKRKMLQKCIISISHLDREYIDDYLIQDMKAPFSNIKEDSGVNLHGIIGTQFFNKFKYVLDFKELIAYSKK